MHSSPSCLVWIAIASLSAASPLPAEIREHPLLEPPPPGLAGIAPNLFAGAKVTASGHWGDRGPAFAVDGRFDLSSDRWGCEKLPAWLSVDLGEARGINAIQLWTFWGGRGDERKYRYVIEGSTDGTSWAVLVDRRSEPCPATARGEFLLFPVTKARYVRATFTEGKSGGKQGGLVVEIQGFELKPQATAAVVAADKAWGDAPKGLQGSVGSIDVRYARETVPTLKKTQAWSGTAWRGERLNGQFVLWTPDGAGQVRLSTAPLTSAGGDVLPASSVRASFVRYVLADGQIMPDVLDDAERMDIPSRSVRPVWLTVDVPSGAKPGTYRGELRVRAAGGVSLAFPLNVEVLPAVLPPPSEWKFRLDLWQSPYSVARYHHVQLWSKEHWALLEPVLRMLADAGQKCLTTTIVHDPWHSQTYDPYESMVEWTKAADGTFHYDYTIFDRYVEFGRKCGIADSINCYSMVPWGDQIRYLDDKTGQYAWIVAPAGSKESDALWRPFLKDFAAHLKQKGWLERTAIAMDERPLEMMKPIIALIREVAPGLKIALAGSNEPVLADKIEDWCVYISPPLKSELSRQRESDKGWPTTYYVCCGPLRPNTFPFSPPAESAWLGWYAAAQDYTGLLRWAYNLWTEDPLYDTSFVRWPAGDCFVVYPGPRSSIRFERLREGIADFEKLRIVRAVLARRGDDKAKAALTRLAEVLKPFTYENVLKTPASDAVNPARERLTEISREIGPEAGDGR